MESSEPSNVTLNAARKIHSVANHHYLPWLGETYRMHLVQVSKKGPDGKTTRNRHINLAHLATFCEVVLAKQVSTDPRNRMRPRNKFGFWLAMQIVFSEFVKLEDWNRRADWTKTPSRTNLEYSGE